ncbi:MAG: AMP-binding protein [Clostridia bacterium]|nr:AMP-binding protein [Clostridia bacterium]
MEFTYDVTMFKDTFEHNFTWINGFLRNVTRFGDRTALFDPIKGKKWTYKELNADCNRFANALKKAGVTKNDVVLYQLLNSFEFVMCYLAPQKLGAVNSPANYNLAAGETAKLLDHNTPKVYVYDTEVMDMATRALALSKHKPQLVIAVDFNGNSKIPDGHILFSDFVENASDSEPETDFRPHIYDEVTRLYTSGTTSLPKGVPINNINEVLSAHDVIMHFPLSPVDITMNMTPWFHRGGLHSGGLTPSLYVGAEVIIFRAFNPKLCLEYAEKYKITFLIGVPAVLGILASRQENHPYDLSLLKGIITMGSPLEKAACIRFQNMLTPHIFNGYGTTESFWNTFLRPYDLPKMSGAAGRACTDDDVRIVKVYDDRKAEPDDLVQTDGQSVGEIIISSPSKSTFTYYNNPEMAEQKFYKGFMYTGDLGTWDENHYVTISGRKDDMIVSSGENIYPSQIEEVLNEYEKVHESIVTSVPDKTRGEVIVAYIIKEDESLTIKELQDYCASHPDLSKYKCPRYYKFIDEMPLTATGKKQHYVMKAQAKKDLEDGLLLRRDAK